jgi:membrane-bound ClpP family serine protease
VQNNRITSTTGDQDISFGNDNKLFRTEEEVLYVNLFKKQGIASTVLRPSGKVTIEGRTYSAEADEQFIEEGSKVQITKIQGNKITVKII